MNVIWLSNGRVRALLRENVKGEEIHYKSLSRKRTFTFHEIKRASTHKNETRFYSAENKKLFSIMTNDAGYDLFIGCLTARNIDMKSENRN